MISERPLNIAFLSTYPPRECGLATFTEDLLMALENVPTMGQSRVVAVSSNSTNYNDKVMLELKQHDRDSYLQTAKELNNSDIDLLVVEHEYGIYGGPRGEYLLNLVNNLEIPFVTTLHTVLPAPDAKQRQILNTLAKKGNKIITMAKNTVEILENSYGIDPSKIAVINHGVPYIPMESREKLKADSGLENRFIVSTFGLLGPGKGLEYGVEAIAKVAQTHKNVLYYILGRTHPAITKRSGEDYRKSLEKMVAKLGIGNNVIFVNKYLSKEEIIRYLKLSDIYLTPYLNKDQAVSGTLAYAAGYGRVIVSTPYLYAQEMLSQGRGLLCEFRNSESIASCIDYVLEHPAEKLQMEQETLETGKTMMWENVAQQYKDLFTSVLQQQENMRSAK